jgi:outer membrane protein insertion porin family
MTTLILLVLNAVLSALPLPPPQSTAPTLQLSAIDVRGARRYTKEDVARLSGLVVGKRVAVSDLEAATKRLAGTGLFRSIQYRYLTTGGGTIVTFEFEEADWTMPVMFDNFVWFTDDELVAALKEGVPSFDGTAPPTTGAPELIARELQKLLESKKIQGRVELLPHGTLKAGIQGLLFRVREPGPIMCSLRFQGATPVAEADLKANMPSIAGTEYSRSYLLIASRGTLTDVYRRRGHWRASFSPPVVVPDKGETCSGVAVTVAVDEGAAYSWDRAEWTGNSAVTGQQLEDLIGIKAGEVANSSRLDDGLRRVQKAYGTQGYLQQRASYTPRLDDATRLAVFEVRIDEGPQFRFGALEFAGLAPDDAEALSKKWLLKPGDVFDDSYPAKFFAQEIRPRLRAGAKPPMLQTRVDAQKQVVNVRYVFGG